MTLLEREPELGAHQSGHNSGVVHAGLYYAPGSLKARLAARARGARGVLPEHTIPVERVGKLVVALTAGRAPAPLRTSASGPSANGVEGLEEIGPERIREIEPHAAGIRALWSPTTAIVDYRRVVRRPGRRGRRRAAGPSGRDAASPGFGHRATSRILETGSGPVVVRDVIACAGLWSDKLAAMTGDAGQERIIPFRGDYYMLRDAARRSSAASSTRCRTRAFRSSASTSPSASTARSGRARMRCSPSPGRATGGAISTRSTWRGSCRTAGSCGLAGRYWRTGAAEFWRDLSKRAFSAACRRYVPELSLAGPRAGPSGCPSAGARSGRHARRRLPAGGADHVLHVRNAPSPPRPHPWPSAESSPRRPSRSSGSA